MQIRYFPSFGEKKISKLKNVVGVIAFTNAAIFLGFISRFLSFLPKCKKSLEYQPPAISNVPHNCSDITGRLVLKKTVFSFCVAE